MSKYEPLGEFLKSQRADRVPMSFAEIERVTRTKLPASAKYRAWWSNNSFNSVMTKIWLEAGFESEQVDMAGRKLVFRRVKTLSESKSAVRGSSTDKAIHPLAGLLKDVTRVAPGFDLTKPADPDWGAK
ncbi:MAG: hypothetical protein HY242_09540 [Afipia sp.]|nr:hypothetical protein [Afipia sp.]